MLALAVLQSWASWPLSPGEITISPSACPPLASGGLQASDAALRAEAWQGLFLIVFVVTFVVALAMVIVAYAATRRIGMPFVRRWTAFMAWSAVAALVVAMVILLLVPVATSGCEATEAMARVPMEWVAMRSLVAAMHGLLLYLLLSALLTALLGRMLRRGRWYDNHRIPFPFLVPRRQG